MNPIETLVRVTTKNACAGIVFIRGRARCTAPILHNFLGWKLEDFLLHAKKMNWSID